MLSGLSSLNKQQIISAKSVYSRCQSTCNSLHPLDNAKSLECAIQCDKQNKKLLVFSNASDLGVITALAFLAFVVVWGIQK